MDIRDLTGKTVLVTGAASGIGKETALAFARRGAGMMLCDLNEAGLAETEGLIRTMGREVFARRVDVSKLEEMEAFAAAVHERVEAVDILMNNAGVGLGASFLETSIADWSWIVGINLWGVIHGCHFFLPKMVARGRGGHVINVSSMAGYLATEPLSAYSTTKFAVLGLSEALRDELVGHRIGVTIVCPGIINTPITHTSPMRGIAAHPAVRQRMVDMYQRRNYGPERVARNILKAVQHNRVVAPISPEAWAMYYVKRFAPWLIRLLNQTVGRRMQRDLERRAASSSS